MESAPAAASAETVHSGDDADSEGGLSRRDREILAFERQWWKYAGAKEQAIRELFDMSATRYYQVLNSLIDTPQALAADPDVGETAAPAASQPSAAAFGPPSRH